jgi:hypothetical protein
VGLQTFYGNGPHPLLWAASRDTREKITISGITNHLNYCEIFIIYTQFTNVAAVRIIQPGGPRVGDPCCIGSAWKFLFNECEDKFVFLCYYSAINPLKYRFKFSRLLTSLRTLHADFVVHECIPELYCRNKLYGSEQMFSSRVYCLSSLLVFIITNTKESRLRR